MIIHIHQQEVEFVLTQCGDRGLRAINARCVVAFRGTNKRESAQYLRLIIRNKDFSAIRHLQTGRARVVTARLPYSFMKECLRSFVKQNGQGVWGFGVAYAKHISLIGPIGPIRCPREPVVTPERVLQTTAQKSRTTPSTRTICERR